MSEFKRLALNLLRKAQEDLAFAATLSKDPTVPRRGVGFHAQQAVEKSMKAVLMHHEIQYPFTHDIKAPAKLVAKAHVPLPPDARGFSRLTPFATVLRYEDEEWESQVSLSNDLILQMAETAVDWAKSHIIP